MQVLFEIIELDDGKIGVKQQGESTLLMTIDFAEQLKSFLEVEGLSMEIAQAMLKAGIERYIATAATPEKISEWQESEDGQAMDWFDFHAEKETVH